jgi:hypothetical protein
MAMTPTYALAHMFFPNLLRVKGAQTIVGVIERKEKFFFDQLWGQAHIEHAPFLHAQTREPFLIGVVDLPPPKEMGEAFFVAIVGKRADPGFNKYFLLEHDYVLAKKADRTLITERDGNRHIKHTDGPVLTANKEVDAKAFIDAVVELLAPTQVTKPTERSWK